MPRNHGKKRLQSYSVGYYEGAGDMQKALWNRALGLYDISYDERYVPEFQWRSARSQAFDEAMNGELKPE